uniref:Uncharacterized protein n=1 Tax=Trichoplusia ni single nucleopolyhedrovirus TaxID=332054 RepID=A0A481V7C7_9ABAC|nr:hypothetical protein [Trichoplusia ni single nucleopolyhedrovirus]
MTSNRVTNIRLTQYCIMFSSTSATARTVVTHHGLAAIHDRSIMNRPYADVAADLFGVGAVSMRD